MRLDTQRMWLMRCEDKLELSLATPQHCITISMKEAPGAGCGLASLHTGPKQLDPDIRSTPRHDEGTAPGR